MSAHVCVLCGGLYDFSATGEAIGGRVCECLRCQNCGKGMRHNIPRMGSAGGYAHTDTGQFQCGPAEPLQVQTFTEETETIVHLQQRLSAAEEHVVWCFSEDEVPLFTQGAAGKHEICDPVTAKQCTYWVAEIIKLRGELNEAKALKK